MESINKEVKEFLEYIATGKVYEEIKSYDSTNEELGNSIFPARMKLLKEKAEKLLKGI